MVSFNNLTHIYALFLFIGLWGCQTSESDSLNSDEGMTEDNRLPVVQVANPERHEYTSELVITGSIEANKEVTLHAMASGYVKAIHKDIGDEVREGELIAELQNPEVYQEYKMAEAAFKEKESAYKRVKGIYDKTPDLTTVEDLERAKADFEAANALTDACAAKLGFLQVKAPFSGVITNRYVDEGALIESGISNAHASPIVDIKDVKTLRLVVEFPESDIVLVKKGGDVMVDFPELPGRAIAAKVTRMANALNPKSKTMRVEIDLDNSDGVLKPGMYAQVKMRLAQHEEAFSVPILAITTVKNEPFIFMVNDNKVAQVSVKLGLEDKYFIEILGINLDSTDQVIIQGKDLVSDGVTVEAQLKMQ